MRRSSKPFSQTLYPGLVVLVLAAGVSRAQDNAATAHLGIYGAGGIASYRDDLLVPISFDGPAFALGAVYSNRTDERRFDSRLKLGAGFLGDRYSHPAYALSLEVRTSWLVRVTESRQAGSLWVGACLPLQMNNEFFDSWDDSHLYWVSAYMLGVAAAWETGVSQEFTARVRVEIPLLGFVSRPPEYRYNKQDALNKWTFHFSEPNKGLELESLGRYRSILIRTVLDHEVSSGTWVFGLEFEYRYCSRPLPVQTMQTSIIASYLWRL